MNRSDKAIDRVLSGLRDVQAPAGMERRLLAAMEERAAARAGYSWRKWAFGLAASVALAAAVVLAVPRRMQQHDVAAVKLPVVVRTPGPVAPIQKHKIEALRSTQNGLRYRASRRDEPAAEDAVASGGIPAPPMPLTEQEKLLLHLAHRSDPQELTPLIAEFRAKQGAEFDAEFQEFFAPPAPPTEQQQKDPTNEDKGESR